MYSELISATIASGGPHAAKTSAVKLMRSVKKVRSKDVTTPVEFAFDLAALVALLLRSKPVVRPHFARLIISSRTAVQQSCPDMRLRISQLLYLCHRAHCR